MKRFELVEGTSSKFWEVSVEGATLKVRYGRIGTEGQAKDKPFASKEKALAEQEKLIREKLSKGYVAARGGSKNSGNKSAGATKKTATTKKSATTKATAKTVANKAVATTKKSATTKATAKTVASKAVATNKASSAARPTSVEPATKFGTESSGPTRDARGFETWKAEDLVRFERGFPNLVELVDGHPHDKQVAKWLRNTAAGVDQVYDVEWPAKVAQAYAHLFGSIRDQGPTAVEKLIAETALPDSPPTEATLKKMLRSCMPCRMTYAGWKAPAAFYIMEHFLGPEVVALAIIERLAGYSKAQWSAKLYGDDDLGRIAGEVLGYLMLRCEPAARKRVQAALDAMLKKHSPKAERSEQLKNCLQEASTTSGNAWGGDFGLRYLDVRACYLDGCDHLLSVPLDGKFSNIREFSKRTMLEWVDHLGRIKHPGVVRVLVAFGAYRAAAPAVQAWIDAHADYVREVLPRFADDPVVQKGVAALGLEPGGSTKTGSTKGEKKAAKKKELGAFETAEKVYEELEKSLPKAFPDQEKVTALIQAAVDECREAARSEGETYMEVHFVNLWAEGFSFDTTEEQFQMLSKAYEDVVIDG